MTTIATERETREPARLVLDRLLIRLVWEVMDVRLPFVFSGDALRYA